MENNSKDEINKVEDLKKKLFSRSYQTRIEDRESFHFVKKDKLKEDWGNDVALTSNNGFRKSPIFQNFFIVSFIVFLGAVGYLLFNFFLKGDDVSNENIEIAVLGNTFSGGGEELPLIIEITNKNSVGLELADLVIEYPKGSAVDSTGEEVARLRQSLGIIKAGEVKSENIKVALFGETGSIHQIKIALEYRLEGTNAIFIKDKLYEVTINRTPINISLEAPADATANQDITFKIKATLNGDIEIANNLVLKLDYPFGFEFVSSNPTPSLGNNIWDLNNINSLKSTDIEITGRMVDVFDGDEKIFHILAGPEKKGDKSELGVVFNSLSHSLFIKKPFIDAKLFVNSEYKKEYSITSKEGLIGSIEWINNLDTTVNDLEIRAKFTGNAFNEKNIKTDPGFYDSKTDTIIWDKNSEEGFVSVLPKSKGVVNFTIAPSSVFTSSGGLMIDPSINIEVSITGKQFQQGSAVKNLDVLETKKVKVISDLSLLAKSSYATGAFKNTGPFPGESEKETTYTITLSLANTTNNISKAKVETTLPPRVEYKNLVLPNSENITFDPISRKLIWNIGTIPRETGLSGPKKEVAFQVSYTPSLSEVGLNPTLVNKITLTGYDDFANVDLKVERPILQAGANIKE